MNTQRRAAVTAAIASALMVIQAGAQIAPERGPTIVEKSYRHPSLEIPNRLIPARQIPAGVPGTTKRQLSNMDVAPDRAFLDRRTGRWATLMPTTRLLQPSSSPQKGWKSLEPSPAATTNASIQKTSWSALESYLRGHAAELGVDVSQLDAAKVTVHDGGFSNTGSIAGGCTETYTLEGSFVDSDTWRGTYSVTFTGLDCSCLGIDPCTDQTFAVTGTR